MSQVTAHFRWEEFACRDGTPVPEEYQSRVETLAVQLEILRAHFNAPIRIISAYRSPDYNEAIGSKPSSQHVRGRAVDIAVSGVSSEMVYAKACSLQDEGNFIMGGCGLYPSFVHIDTRGTKARWTG